MYLAGRSCLREDGWRIALRLSVSNVDLRPSVLWLYCYDEMESPRNTFLSHIIAFFIKIHSKIREALENKPFVVQIQSRMLYSISCSSSWYLCKRVAWYETHEKDFSTCHKIQGCAVLMHNLCFEWFYPFSIYLQNISCYMKSLELAWRIFCLSIFFVLAKGEDSL